MAYLSGLSVGKQPSPGLGALTGFASGLSRGMQDAEQMKAQRARTQLMQQEMQLRQQAMKHGLEKDQQVTDWSRKLGEYQAWRAGSGDEIEQQGPTQPGAAKLPSSTNWDAISAKLGELASTIPDARTRDAFLAVAREEEQAKALAGHKDRVLAGINDRVANNSYSRRVYGGAEDPTGSEAAQALMEQVQNLDMSDPQAAAELLDYVEKQDRDLRVATVAHNVKMERRESMLANVEQQVMAREGAGVPMDEAKALVAAYKGGLVEDEQFQKYLPDALAGTLQMKMMAAQKDQEIQALQKEILMMRLQQERGSMAPGGVGGLDRQHPREDPRSLYAGADLGAPRRASQTNGSTRQMPWAEAVRTARAELGDDAEPSVIQDRAEEMIRTGGPRTPPPSPEQAKASAIQTILSRQIPREQAEALAKQHGITAQDLTGGGQQPEPEGEATQQILGPPPSRAAAQARISALESKLAEIESGKWTPSVEDFTKAFVDLEKRGVARVTEPARNAIGRGIGNLATNVFHAKQAIREKISELLDPLKPDPKEMARIIREELAAAKAGLE